MQDEEFKDLNHRLFLTYKQWAKELPGVNRLEDIDLSLKGETIIWAFMFSLGWIFWSMKKAHDDPEGFSLLVADSLESPTSGEEIYHLTELLADVVGEVLRRQKLWIIRPVGEGEQEEEEGNGDD